MLPSKLKARERLPPPAMKGGQAVTKALNASPPPTANGVDKLYHQLKEIHIIAAMQLAECTH
jgi:hypothetical protein